MNAETEIRLVRAAAAGRRDAFEDLVRQYTPRIRGFVMLMAPDDPDDLVQETFSQAWKGLSNFRGESRFSSWLLGIALNITRHRRRKHSKEEAVAPESLDRKTGRRKSRSVLSSVVRRESADRIALAIERLPLTLREPFVLKYVEDLDYQEIAVISGITEGTARVRAHRARLLLQEELGPSFETLFKSASI